MAQEEKIKYSVDIKAIQKLLAEMRLNTKEARRAIRLGLSQSGRIIRNQARVNLSRAYCKSGSINSDPLKRFVRSGVYKDLGGTVVTIVGNHRKKYAERLAAKGIKDLAFTLKFFQEGTDVRFNKTKRKGKYIKQRLNKQRYTGSIIPSKFFSNAVANKQQTAQELLQGFIEKHIRRIAKRHQSI